MSALDQTFVKLSWALIEYKILYYNPEKFTHRFLEKHSAPDYEYDRLEAKYLRLCKILKKPNTVQSMVGVDYKRHSVQLALAKLEAKGAIEKKTRKLRKKQFTAST